MTRNTNRLLKSCGRRPNARWSRNVCTGTAIRELRALANTVLSSAGRTSPPAASVSILRNAFPANPLPLSCFDHPRARATPSATPENPDLFFAGLSASYLAGYPKRPHGAALGRIFRAADLTPVERDQLWHIFACIHTKNLVRLLARGRPLHLPGRARHPPLSSSVRQRRCLDQPVRRAPRIHQRIGVCLTPVIDRGRSQFHRSSPRHRWSRPVVLLRDSEQRRS